MVKKSYGLHQLLPLRHYSVTASSEWNWPHDPKKVALVGVPNRYLGGFIKTHDSESRGQEEAGRTRRTSELFTRSTALKFVNALNKPP